jgi:biotin synthase
MAGLPGQSYKSLAQDIQLFEKFDLDLLCIGPYLPHPDTPMAAGSLSTPLPEGQQVPISAEMVYRVLALCRRLYPRLHIITTTALGTLNPVNGRELGLVRGGNMVAANVTPAKYRKLYDVYPDRICLREPAERSVELLRGRIRGIGRRVTIGPGLPSATKFL